MKIIIIGILLLLCSCAHNEYRLTSEECERLNSNGVPEVCAFGAVSQNGVTLWVRVGDEVTEHYFVSTKKEDVNVKFDDNIKIF